MQMFDGSTIENYAPYFSEIEGALALKAINSGWVSYAGSYVTEFEEKVANSIGCIGAVALASGTCALQVAFELLGRPDTEVIMPALTFAAPASVAVRAGMVPIFVDLHEQTWQMNVDLVEEFLANHCVKGKAGLINKQSGRVVSTICIVHLWGGLADLTRVYELATEYGLTVIQDAAQSLGAGYLEAPFGAHAAAYPDVVTAIATSFNANKIITTGAGGAFLANDSTLLQRARHMASTAKTNGYSFEHDAFGINYRMSNINAAVGVAQITKLPLFVQRKRSIQDEYAMQLASAFGPRTQMAQPVEGSTGNCWSYCVMLEISSERVIQRVQKAGIQARPVWIPLIDLPIYKKYQQAGSQGVARKIWAQGIMLPAGPSLTSDQIRRVVSTLAAELK